ncbi:hypothetical protein RN001_007413 [Aquatica leii]|uniref:Uncharacterized protein n=1 Tax=Aquatica leii TaxID=1421715 RepID=A0AAN7P8A3_9COLE|nr:hypothetical protein RN001_007413 [Aquatica leii]
MAIVLEIPRDIDKLCRTCMNLIDCENNVPNFVIVDNTQTELCGMLQTVTSLKVTLQDGLPKSLCSHCADQLKTAYTFILQCTQVDHNLKRILESSNCINGDPSNVTKLKTETLDDFTCSLCELSFMSYYELSMHLITHNSSKSLIERFNESFCDIDNKYNIDVKQDIEEQRLLIEECRNNLSLQNVTSIGAKCHKTAVDKTISTGPIFKKRLQCKNCNKHFQSEESLQRHISECGSKYKPALCNLCGKTCKDFSSLSLHFLNHSLTSDLLSENVVSEVHFCEFCGQLFENDSCLSQHYTEQHENRPNMECFECFEIFDTEKDFLAHLTLHSNDENSDSYEELQCVLCPEKFNSKSELYKHSFSHLMKRYTCRKCSLSFCTQDSYFAHLPVHSSGKHVCSLCGKCLSTSSALKCHIEGVHPVELQHCCSVLAITIEISKRKCISNERDWTLLKAIDAVKSTKFSAPWMLSLVDLSNNEKNIVCGAVIISVKWALTTAYCISSVSNKTDVAFYGGYSSMNDGGIYHSFTNVILHKSYNTIAIVEVIPYFNNLREIPIGIDEHVYKTKLNIYGWQTESHHKNLIKIVITEFTFCNLTDGKKKSMCIKLHSKAYSFIDVLPGAAFVKDNVIIGMSYDVLQFKTNTAYGMFLNVTSSNRWIQENICANLK